MAVEVFLSYPSLRFRNKTKIAETLKSLRHVDLLGNKYLQAIPAVLYLSRKTWLSIKGTDFATRRFSKVSFLKTPTSRSSVIFVFSLEHN